MSDLWKRGILLEATDPVTANPNIFAQGLRGMLNRGVPSPGTSYLREPLPMHGRLTFLPARITPEGPEFAMPGLLASAWNAFTAPGRAALGDPVGPEEGMNLAGMLGLGALPLPKPSGILGMNVWHGSPHKFDRFDSAKIGTGEGAQVYGHGHYLAENPGVAQSYQHGLAKPDFTKNAEGVPMRGRLPEMLEEAFGQIVSQQGGRHTVTPRDAADLVSANLDRQMADALKAGDMNWYSRVSDMKSDLWRFQQKPAKAVGHLYKVDLPDEAIGKMLDWDKPLSQQSDVVRTAFEKAYPGSLEKYGDKTVQAMFPYGGINKAVAENLRSVGIPGIKYLDQGSRAGGNGTYNFVVFDDSLPKIVGRE